MRWQEKHEMTRGAWDDNTDRDHLAHKKRAGQRPALQRTREAWILYIYVAYYTIIYHIIHLYQHIVQLYNILYNYINILYNYITYSTIISTCYTII